MSSPSSSAPPPNAAAGTGTMDTVAASSAATSPAGFPLWGVGHRTWFLVGVHVIFVATPPALCLNAAEYSVAQTVSIVLLSLAIGGLQIRHSLAASRGTRPAGWRWTMLAMVALTYLPLVWFSWDVPLEWSAHGLYTAAVTAVREDAVTNWALNALFVAASAAMFMRARHTGWILTGVIAPPLAVVLAWEWIAGGGVIAFVAMSAIYRLSVWIVFAATLYWSVRLVRTVDELFAVRTALAESAVVEERQRISRDLHDLLGQSLSAISLKGDLAMRLWPTDRAAAMAEIDSLTDVASKALRDVRGVTHTTHEVSLDTEFDQASTLLDAASIEVRASLDLPPLAPGVDGLLGWAVREGATNMLRHSEARTCWITAGARDGAVWLEMVNDGVRSAAGSGTGLSGLAQRVRALSGSVTAERTRAGRFRLRVEIPNGSSATTPRMGAAGLADR